MLGIPYLQHHTARPTADMRNETRQPHPDRTSREPHPEPGQTREHAANRVLRDQDALRRAMRRPVAPTRPTLLALDDADLAAEIEMTMRDDALLRATRGRAPVTHVDTCIECSEPIHPARVQLGLATCIDCAQMAERRQRALGHARWQA